MQDKTPYSPAKRHAVSVLNEIFNRDTALANKLIEWEYPIGQWVLDHPTLVPGGTVENPTIGLIGLLNGLLGYADDGEDSERLTRNHHQRTGELTGFSVQEISLPAMSWDIGKEKNGRSVFQYFLAGKLVMNGEICWYQPEFEVFANGGVRAFKLNQDIEAFGYEKGETFTTKMIAGIYFVFPMNPRKDQVGFKLSEFSEYFDEMVGTLINQQRITVQRGVTNHISKRYGLLESVCGYSAGDTFESVSIGGEIYFVREELNIGDEALPFDEFEKYFEMIGEQL